MRKILILLLVLVGTSCAPSGGELVWDNSALYEIRGEEDQVFYFQHPLAAEVFEENGEGYIDFGGCHVDFGHETGMQAGKNVDVKEHESDDRRFEAWYENNSLVFYAGRVKAGYVFWVYEEGSDVSGCIDMIDSIVGSFIDEPIYFNEKYSFKSGLLYDYKLEYLPSGEGILMKKWIGDNMCEDEYEGEYECGYKVEISVFGFENLMGWSDVLGYVADKYAGYNAEFASYNDTAGVFVDEGAGEYAIRHYFVMGRNSDALVEAYMKIPSLYYSGHKSEFDEFAMTIETF